MEVAGRGENGERNSILSLDVPEYEVCIDAGGRREKRSLSRGLRNAHRHALDCMQES